MFEPRITEPTDDDLVETLATRGMGWAIFNHSDHRPGSRAIPHAWRWRRDRVHLMVYVGGHGEGANVEFAPLSDEACARELEARLATKGINLDGWDLATADGRRAFCVAAAGRLDAVPVVAAPEPEPIGTPAKLTAHTGEFPPTFLTAGDEIVAAEQRREMDHGQR